MSRWRRVARVVGGHIVSRAGIGHRPPVSEAYDIVPDPLMGLDTDVAERVDIWNVSDAPHDFCEVIALLLHVPTSGSFAGRFAGGDHTLPKVVTVEYTAWERSEAESDERAVADLARGADALRSEGWNEADLTAAAEAVRRVRLRHTFSDVLAFYRPFSTLDEVDATAHALGISSSWGVYLTTAGIEIVANELLDDVPGLQPETAVKSAAAYLLGHEIGHASVDIAVASDDLMEARPRIAHLAAAHRAAHGGAACPLEEAFCEAYALRFVDAQTRNLGVDPDTRRGITEAITARVAAGPPGYRDGADLLVSDEPGRDLHRSLLALLEHVGVDDVDRAALLADLERRSVTTADVPVRFVVSPGSGYANGSWFAAGTQPIV